LRVDGCEKKRHALIPFQIDPKRQLGRGGDSEEKREIPETYNKYQDVMQLIGDRLI